MVEDGRGHGVPHPAENIEHGGCINRVDRVKELVGPSDGRPLGQLRQRNLGCAMLVEDQRGAAEPGDIDRYYGPLGRRVAQFGYGRR